MPGYGMAFPDVKMTPPANPSTPPGVPVPYPNYGMSKDTPDGVKKVKVGGQDVELHRKPEYSVPQPLPTPKPHNHGKSEFYYYPIDVKVEAPEAPRFIDLHTKNHG